MKERALTAAFGGVLLAGMVGLEPCEALSGYANRLLNAENAKASG